MASIVNHTASPSDWRDLSRWQIAEIAAAAATRVAPLYALFTGTSGSRYQTWVEQLWQAIDARESGPVRQIREQLNAAPEADTDDSSLPAYYAMRALSVLDYAASVLIDDDFQKSGARSLRAARALWAELDAAESEALRSRELHAQDVSTRLVIASEHHPQARAGERKADPEVVAQLDAIYDQLARTHGWTSPNE